MKKDISNTLKTTTTNYELIKPGQDDFYNIDEFNQNMDIIDNKIKDIEDYMLGIQLTWDNITGKPEAFKPEDHSIHSMIESQGDVFTGGKIATKKLTTGNEQLIIGVDDTIYVGNPITKLNLESLETPKVTVGGHIYKMYHDGLGIGGVLRHIQIQVAGDLNTYYPVIIPEVPNMISELQIYRGIHEDSNRRGSLMARFLRTPHAWGNYPGKVFLEEYCTQEKNFIGDYEYGTSGAHATIIWLLGGGTTYHFLYDGWLNENEKYKTITPLYSRTNIGNEEYPVWVEPKSVSILPLASGRIYNEGYCTGSIEANSNTGYTIRQIRNTTMSTSNPSGGKNGDIHIKYS